MLLTKEIEVKLSSQTSVYYEGLGYTIPRRIDKYGVLRFEGGTKIIIKIDDLYKNSDYKIEYSCDGCGKEFQTTYCAYNNRKQRIEGDFCQKCAVKDGAMRSYKTNLEKSKSFYDWCMDENRLDLLERWDEELNTENPKDVSYKSNKKFFFLCPDGIHESRNATLNQVMRHGGRIECNTCNSMGFLYPQSVLIWSEKNNIDIYSVMAYSNKKFLWECENRKHNEYKRTGHASIRFEFRCPECVKERKESFIHEKVRKYLLLDFDILMESKCRLKCINPKTNKLLPYDFEVPSLGLIIETHGEQHYRTCGWHYRLNNPKEEFKYLQWKDEFKKQYAIDQGYYYIAISYLEEKDDQYKTSIDNMIDYILSNN